MIKQHNIQYLRSLPKVGQNPERPDTSDNVFSSTVSALMGQLRGLLGTAAVEGLGDAAKKLEEQINRNIKPIEALNTQLGTSTIISAQIFQNFQKISDQNSKLLLTNQQFVKSAGALNQILPGTIALFSAQSELTNDILMSQTKATELLGVQTANAAAFNTFLLANGESAEGVFDELARTANIIESTTGQTGVLKDMLDAVGSTSAVTRMTFRGSAEELGKAALQANRMGTTLDNIAASAKSMLDVESQIGAEMEFQLLTGQNISQQTNEMRVAAFTGDLDRVAEIQKELIEANYEALKGNPIAMEAFAKSIGMSTDELAKQGETIKARNELLSVTTSGIEEGLGELFKQFGIDPAKGLGAGLEQLANLSGVERDKAREALSNLNGVNSELIESFDQYVTATDVRTQEQRLEDSITNLTNTISSVLGPENVKDIIQSQYAVIEKFTSTSRDIIKDAEGTIQEGGDISGVVSSIADAISSAFNKDNTKENIANSVSAGIERAFAASKYFKQLAQPDNRGGK